jgi:hypothetical protein
MSGTVEEAKRTKLESKRMLGVFQDLDLSLWCVIFQFSNTSHSIIPILFDYDKSGYKITSTLYELLLSSGTMYSPITPPPTPPPGYSPWSSDGSDVEQ